MEKEEDQKIVSSTNQETETTELSINEEQNTHNVTLDSKNAKTGSPSHKNATSLNQQYQAVLQWPYTPQHTEQSSMNSRPFISTQLPSPVVASQWQQLSNSTNNQVQQGQPPPQLAQSATPFWMPPRPGCHLSGVSIPAPFQAFTPFGTINASWQAPVVIGGATSSSNQPQAPNFCYPVGYPFPSFPGPWDPSSWYVHGQQSHLPCTYTSPGGYGYASAVSPPSPGCTASLEQPFQRGIIRPLAKLSQKHQRLWEAQSAENVQLWAVIGQLQSELADYKSRLMKLEAEVSSLRPTVEKTTTRVTGTALSGQASKRGRPRKLTAAVDVLPTPDEQYRRARGKKPAALCKAQSAEPRTLVFEKVNLIKVEDRVKARHSPATTQQENDKKISNMITTSSNIMEVNRSDLMMPAFNGQEQENPRIQISGIHLNSSSKMENIGEKADDSGADFAVLSQQPKGIHSKESSATHIGTAANGSFCWPSNINPGSCGRTFNKSSRSIYNNGSVIRQEGKHIPGWSFVDEESAPEQLEEGVVGLAKNGNEDEMGEDASSADEEIAPTKDETAYTWIVR